MGVLLEFLRNPRRTGAVMASSQAVVTSLLRGLPLSRARVVLELGAGDGAVTEALVRDLPPRAQLLAVEVNAALASRLRRRFTDPRVEVVRGSAVDLEAMLAVRGLRHADCVVSGLPWTAMTAEDRARVVTAAARALGPGGRFRTLLCWHVRRSAAGRDTLELLRSCFATVRQVELVWTNLPPLLVLDCQVGARVTAEPDRRRAVT
ncbi:class I SAM-dependent methyltransferase [Crossiella sp. NPDC003009]